MIDHRRVQRLLFRMQLDPRFAEALRNGGLEEPGLGPEERAWLLSASPAALAADHLGRRRAQVLGNIASEYVLTLAEAATGALGAGFAGEFPASAEFHAAMAEDELLPLAFGAWASRLSAERGEPVVAAFAALETAMARARREPRAAATPGPGELALSPRAWLVQLPDGAFQHAQQLRMAVDGSGEPARAPAELSARASKWLRAARGGSEDVTTIVESVLLVVVEALGGHRMREVAPERLEPDAAALLYEAREPLSEARLGTLIASRNWEAADVADFVDSLVVDGVLCRG